MLIFWLIRRHENTITFCIHNNPKVSVGFVTFTGFCQLLYLSLALPPFFFSQKASSISFVHWCACEGYHFYFEHFCHLVTGGLFVIQTNINKYSGTKNVLLPLHCQIVQKLSDWLKRNHSLTYHLMETPY